MIRRTFVSLRRTALSAAVARVLVLGALALAGCNDNPVGRLCDLGAVPGEDQSVVASGSLDCVSRTCLHVPLKSDELPPGSQYPTGQNGLCTAECESDDDCDRVPESPCKGGFACGVPITAGATFCCKKFCICKDYVDFVDRNPAACDPSNPVNECCNLPGRCQ